MAVIGKKKNVAEIVIDKRLIRIIAPLVLDTNISVQHAAVGALRNISLSDPSICDHMVEQDIFTPLNKLLRQFQETDWQLGKKAGNRIDSKSEIFIEAINLLWNLCEANETIVNISLEQDLLTVLVKHLTVEKYGYQVVTTVLQCIYTLSECKERHLNLFKNFEHVFKSLLVKNALSPEDLHVKILAFGIAANLLEARNESMEPMISELMNALSNTLDQDQRKIVHDYSSSIPISEEVASDQMDQDQRDVPRHEHIRREIDHVVLGQQMALEILANLCCGEVNEWEEASHSEESDDDTEESAMKEEDMALEPSNMSSILLEAIKAHGILEKVLYKAKLPADNVQEILMSSIGLQHDGSMVLQMLQTLQSKAFLCLNNLIEYVPIEDLGGEDKLFQVWKDLGSLSLSANSEQVIESATSAMRASTQKLLPSKILHQIGGQEVDQLAEYGAKHKNASIRTNVVAILGTIGQSIAAQLETTSQAGPLHLTISMFLLEAASRDVELRVVAEALDKLFDMFSEDFTDELCAQVQVVQRLKQLQPGLKVKINMNRKNQKSDPDTHAMAVMAKTNLTRFIKYKDQRYKKSQNGNH